MAGQAKAKGKKIGRNKDWCAAYRMRGTRERNKRLKLARHLKRHPNDKQAAA